MAGILTVTTEACPDGYTSMCVWAMNCILIQKCKVCKGFIVHLVTMVTIVGTVAAHPVTVPLRPYVLEFKLVWHTL